MISVILAGEQGVDVWHVLHADRIRRRYAVVNRHLLVPCFAGQGLRFAACTVQASPQWLRSRSAVLCFRHETRTSSPQGGGGFLALRRAVRTVPSPTP